MKSFKGDIPFQRLINLATHKFRLCRAENKYRIPFDISGNNQDLVFDKGWRIEYKRDISKGKKSSLSLSLVAFFETKEW